MTTKQDTRNRTTIDGLRVGLQIELVRWTMRFDNWEPITVRGQFISRDDSSITLAISGETRTFDRTEWELCIA